MNSILYVGMRLSITHTHCLARKYESSIYIACTKYYIFIYIIYIIKTRLFNITSAKIEFFITYSTKDIIMYMVIV